MSIALITGSGGLIGSEAVLFFHELGFNIAGIDNDMRKIFFGDDASTQWNITHLKKKLKNYTHYTDDIRDQGAMQRIFQKYGREVELIIHTAAQPSHDWAANDPFTDFGVNANGTLNLLENTRRYAPDAVFIFTSTNKVYGDTPNSLPLIERETRWEIDPGHEYADGITEAMSIDHSKHSLFGASKVAADILAQEYGQYFGLKTGIFRGGCLTGPRHSGTMLHGFLAYLMKCTVAGTPYTVFGYKGKQVRDNIHSYDLVNAFYHFYKCPRIGEVYNLGGGRLSNCSMLEAVELCEKITQRKLNWHYSEKNRIGDHVWWISGLKKFRIHYPDWELKFTINDILQQIFDFNAEHWFSSGAGV